ncbi:hypothetical protein [Neptunicoccus cionae]|uniref:hypothetical protein n=1 Tax=Neptunicoccus cionae TaxID=2035344 RepID=UPI000C766937|nr:hypothetical protein [Amylibacter cionae]PLS21767.1 hypothetical protein C0U40_09775 [Amylibacter cionae]
MSAHVFHAITVEITPNAKAIMPPHAHILTDIDPRLFLKQTPDKQPEFQGVRFTFGLEVDPAADVLIIYTRASWSLQTTLPRARTFFVAGEPEEIHPYSAAFLNQFAAVVAPGKKPLETERLDHNYCLLWFAGVDFANLDGALGYDHFKALQPPAKDDKISIVTSTKASTEYHRKRLAFIEVLKEKIPEHIELYGRGFKPVDDKMDALLPHKYHLALENGAGRYTWTEKLSDPLLCWALPFYVGCTNVADELPADSIVPLDMDRPGEAINRMMKARTDDLWSDRLDTLRITRDLLLEEFNTMGLFARLTKQGMETPTASGTKRMIYAERALPPEKGSRGSLPEMILRRGISTLAPGFDLRMARLRKRMKEKRG